MVSTTVPLGPYPAGRKRRTRALVGDEVAPIWIVALPGLGVGALVIPKRFVAIVFICCLAFFSLRERYRDRTLSPTEDFYKSRRTIALLVVPRKPFD